MVGAQSTQAREGDSKRNIARRGCAIVIALALTNCSAIDREMARSVKGGSCFARSLGREYLQLAYVFDSRGLVFAGETFRTKAGEAMRGKEVSPILARDTLFGANPERDELGKAEKALLRLKSLDTTIGHPNPIGQETARERLPMEIAHAQGRYDCWAEASFRPWLHDMEMTCKSEFKRALCYAAARLDQPLTGESGSLCADYDPVGWGQTPIEPLDADPWLIGRPPIPSDC